MPVQGFCSVTGWCSWSCSLDICLLGVSRVLCSVSQYLSNSSKAIVRFHYCWPGLGLDPWVKDLLARLFELYEAFWPLPHCFGNSIWKRILVMFFSSNALPVRGSEFLKSFVVLVSKYSCIILSLKLTVINVWNTSFV